MAAGRFLLVVAESLLKFGAGAAAFPQESAEQRQPRHAAERFQDVGRQTPVGWQQLGERLLPGPEIFTAG